MTELTPENAEKFARSIFENDPVKKEGEWHIFHSKAVEETALLLAGKSEIDRALLREASWLINIGETISNGEGHPLRSLDMAKEEFELPEKLKDCIINHEELANPVCEEAKIIQVADKLSILKPEIIELFYKYSSENSTEKEWNIKFLESFLSKIPNLLRRI
jgi:HD superfamily phosphodiesterase